MSGRTPTRTRPSIPDAEALEVEAEIAAEDDDAFLPRRKRRKATWRACSTSMPRTRTRSDGRGARYSPPPDLAFEDDAA